MELRELSRTYLASIRSCLREYGVMVSRFGRFTVSSCMAAAMLAGCGGSQPPIAAPGAMLQTAAIATHVDRDKSWMRNSTRIDSRTTYKVTPQLLYVTNVGYEDVTVYQAKANDREPVETISDGLVIPTGACVDGQGTLYVTN